MTTRIAITSSFFLALPLWLLKKAQAMSPPLHQSYGIRANVAE